MRVFFTIMLLFIVPFLVIGQTSFTASVNKGDMALNETFQISFVLKNGKTKNFTPPSFEGLKIVSGPHTSQSTQMVNFDVTTSITWTYAMQALKKGQIVIGSATVKVDNKVLESNKIKIEVGEASVNNNQKQNNNSGQVDENTIRQNLFVKQIIDKRNVYVGEQVTVTYQLYNRVSVVNVSPGKSPSYEGFWTQEIALDKNQQRNFEVIDNQRFEVVTLKKEAIFPQRSGELKLNPLELDAVVRIQTSAKARSLFEEMFGNYRIKDVPIEISSNSSVINVKPLPGGKPKGYNGAVGKYKLESSVDATEGMTDNPITISVKISGQGNIRMIEKPALVLPPNFDMFDPKVKEYVSAKSTYVNGYKSYDYLIIPRAPGQYKIPPVSFSYFDTQLEKYVTEESAEYVLNIGGEASADNISSIGLSKEEVELITSDIRYIKPLRTLSKPSPAFFRSIPYYTLCISPFALFMGLLIVRKRMDSRYANIGGLRSKAAGRVAKKRLAKARKLLREEKFSEYFDEVQRSIWDYMSDKFVVKHAELSKEHIAEKISEKGIDKTVSDKLIDILNSCEMYLYAPSALKGNEEKVYEQAHFVISEIEKKI